ncbi:MAG: DUF5615 family PIN-like protein [Pyrinomonadaceae bacterium]|jgi:hypothetical protein|nr:DUF5615 family PIN-like protein [Pyrinomonadaceae bacterium]
MKFYADENFPLRTVQELRNLGHDVLTAFEDDKANQSISDDDLLKRATELKRAVLTHNRLDFKRLHQQNENHCGIVICTENPNRFELAEKVQEAVSKVETLENELVRVYRPSA